jgi:hypothetical protein
MNENTRLEILELLASQKITAQEAADMLRAIDAGAGAEAQPEKGAAVETEEPVYKPAVEHSLSRDPWADDAYESAEGKPRWLRIRVRDMASERNKVTVNVPLWLVGMGLGAARRFGADMGDFDPDMIRQMIKEGQRGVLVDVQDEEDGEHVQIYLD